MENYKTSELFTLDLTNFFSQIGSIPVNTSNQVLNAALCKSYVENIPDIGILINEITKDEIIKNQDKLLIANASSEQKERFDIETGEKFLINGKRFVCKFYKHTQKFYSYQKHSGAKKRAAKGYKFDSYGQEVELTEEDKKQRKKESKRVAFNRAIQQFKDYAMANEWSYMLMFTFNNKKYKEAGQVREQALKKLANFMTMAVKKNRDFKLLMTIERGHRGTKRIHFHGFINRIADEFVKEFEKVPFKLRKYAKQGVYQLPLWSYGHSTLIRLVGEDNQIKATNYALKYVIKELYTLESEGKQSRERNLKQNIFIQRQVKNVKAEVVAELLGVKCKKYFKWEDGSDQIRLLNDNNLNKLAKLFDLPPEELVTVKTKNNKSYFKTQNLNLPPKVFMDAEGIEQLSLNKAYEYVDYYSPIENLTFEDYYRQKERAKSEAKEEYRKRQLVINLRNEIKELAKDLYIKRIYVASKEEEFQKKLLNEKQDFLNELVKESDEKEEGFLSEEEFDLDDIFGEN